MANNKFNEDIILDKIKKYIDFTYEQHYGKKEARNEADLYKIIHYAIILLGQMDKEEKEKLREFEDHMQEGAD